MKKIIILLIFILLLTSCGIKGNLHKEEELYEYTDNLICNTRTEESCNLKDKYKLVRLSEKDEERTLELKLKDKELYFETTSSLHCTGSIDGSCFESTYKITSTYQYESYKYLIKEYEKEINYNNEYCELVNNECSLTMFRIKSKKDLEYIINYYKGFIKYLNNQDIITTPLDIIVYIGDKYDSLRLGIEYLNKKYVPLYEGTDIPLDGNIDTYINNYLYRKGITLE